MMLNDGQWLDITAVLVLPVERMATSRSQILNFPSGNYNLRLKFILQQIHEYFPGTTKFRSCLTTWGMVTMQSSTASAFSSSKLKWVEIVILNLQSSAQIYWPLSLRKKTLKGWFAVQLKTQFIASFADTPNKKPWKKSVCRLLSMRMYILCVVKCWIP